MKAMSSSKTQGLWSLAAMLSLIVWFITSFLTLFMNKYTLSVLGVEAFLFSTIQIAVSTIMGFGNMFYPCYMGKKSRDWRQRSKKFYCDMCLVGMTRFLVVFLSLLSLEYVAVSFTETVKSSAPIFTVFISWFLVGERNGIYVTMSLLPIMLGLMMCSTYEVSFNVAGFLAALATNVAECLQFVLSKKALSGQITKTTPAEFQFFSCLASIVVQIPICLLLMDFKSAYDSMTLYSLTWMVMNGIMYHYQTMTAWVLMEYVSPVTHSVCNTVKRAMAIWLSILVYDNPVTFLGNLGTAVVILGVLLYNKAREYEQGRKGVGRTYLLKNPPDSSANGGSPTAFQAAPPTFDATLKTPLHSREFGEFV